jgi:hypothetical protein
MTETQYINLSNLQRLRCAQAVLREVLAFEDAEVKPHERPGLTRTFHRSGKRRRTD